MAADSPSEVSKNPPVKDDTAAKVLSEDFKTAMQTGLQYVEKNAENLRAAGVLPELAIDGSGEIAYVQKNFDKIDGSGDGHITSDEINKYVKDNGAKLAPEVLEALRKVAEKIGSLEELSDDETFDENDGITKKDLDVAQQRFRALDFAQKNFDKIDGNADGHITSEEVDGYVKAQGGKLNGKELENLDFLKKNVSDLEEMNDDEFGDENDGFTKHDLLKARQEDGTDTFSSAQMPRDAVAATGDLRPALDFAKQNFDKIDGDKDGYLSSAEIDKYMADHRDSVSSEDLAKLRALKEKIGDVEEQSNDETGDENDGITRKDIDASKERIDALAYGKDNFDKIDGDANGHITAEEIDSFIKARGDLPAEEVKKLNLLKQQVSDLEEYHDDEFGDENDGFTKHDLADALDELGSASARAKNPPVVSESNPVRAEQNPVRRAERPVQNPDYRQDVPERFRYDRPAENAYEVQRGDTLWKICSDYLRRVSNGQQPSGNDVERIVREVAQANGIQDPDKIYPGQKIRLPQEPSQNSGRYGYDQYTPRNGYDRYGRDHSRYDYNRYGQNYPRNGYDRYGQTNPRREYGDYRSAQVPQRSQEVQRSAVNGAQPEPRTAESGFDYVKKRFADLDQDNNNHVTKSEIDKFIKDNEKTLKPAEVDALKKIADRESDLEELFDDEMGDENDGITRQDLDVAEKQMKAVEFAQKNFEKLDGDGNGFVTEGEVDAYLRANGDRLNAADRVSLETLKAQVSELEEHANDEIGDENDGFTKADLKGALEQMGSSTFEGTNRLPLPASVTRDYDRSTARIKGEDFTKESLRLFDKLDKDADGFLSESELATAVQSEEYTGKDAQVVAALYRATEDIEELSDDEYFDEDNGITKKDLEKLEEKRQHNAKELELTARAAAFLDRDGNFAKIDSDGDKFLTKAEITKALERKDISPEDRVSLEFLRDHEDDIEEAHDDELGDENNGMSREDLDYYGDDAVAYVVNTLARVNDAQTTGTRNLYGNMANPRDSIKPDAVMQGVIGDCYFEAAVASLAAVDPDLIQKMIKDNGDGTYTVTFPGAPDEPITVQAPTEAEMGLYNQGGMNGSWACVLEKAYGEYSQKHFWRRGPHNMGGGNTPTEGADGGEHPLMMGRAMNLLTGHSNNTDSLSLSSEATIAERLDQALNGTSKHPVIAGISGSIFNLGPDKTDDGFYTAHMYSVVAFDPNGPDGGTVTIRNPWGDGENSTRGTIKISVKQFRKNFSMVAYGQ